MEKIKALKTLLENVMDDSGESDYCEAFDDKCYGVRCSDCPFNEEGNLREVVDILEEVIKQ